MTSHDAPTTLSGSSSGSACSSTLDVVSLYDFRHSDRCGLMKVLTGISLMDNEVEHFSMCF